MKRRILNIDITDGRFQVFAVKVKETSRVGRRGLNGESPYYFYQGYDVMDSGDVIYVNQDINIRDVIFNDYLVEQSRKASITKEIPHISISGIVGKNGSGKSSVVEYVLRLINNYSVILFGEGLSGYGLEHLHYIDWMDGELFFFIDGAIYRLCITGRKVELDCFELDEDDITKNGWDTYRKNKEYHQEIEENDTSPITEEYGDFEQLKPFLEHFFYTVVSNYSIYAYNTLDYKDENNTVEYERELYKYANVEDADNLRIDISDCNWLHGLFHKNDGYKTPLVLTPYREKGNIDINVENTLSIERFISMLMMSHDDLGGYNRINGHLTVEHFEIRLKGDYGREYMNKALDITTVNKNLFLSLQLMILDGWGYKLLGDMDKLENHAKTKAFGDEALNYLVYKTIKIATKYKEYEWLNSTLDLYLKGNVDDLDMNGEMFDYIDSLLTNRSHITRKIRQVVAYLLTEDEDDVYKCDDNILEVKVLSEKAKKTIKKIRDKYGYDFYVRGIEDMIPPAFLETRMILREVNGNGEDISFETLSSGEKQQIFSICGLMYHLLNINSVKDDEASERISYSNVNVILEEIELYFHPDFQKKYISMILDGIAQLNLNNIRGINLCFVTHSPFILSDIPKSNLLVMNGGRSEKNDNLKTFGANIYDMLSDSFFLEGTPIGSYAQWMITRIIVSLRVWVYLKSIGNVEPMIIDLINNIKSGELEDSSFSFLDSYFAKNGLMNSFQFKKDYNKNKLKHIIRMIDEVFVRENLMNEYYRVFPEEFDRLGEIEKLERRLEILKKGE